MPDTTSHEGTAGHSTRVDGESTVTKSFNLLGLPLELREQVYDAVYQIQPAVLHRDGTSVLTPSRLPLTCRQVKKELTDYTRRKARLVARVIDFDFTHVICWLRNRRHTFSNDTSTSQRTRVAPRQPMTLAIKFDKGLHSNSASEEHLIHWLRQVKYFNHRAVNTSWSYEVDISGWQFEKVEAAFKHMKWRLAGDVTALKEWCRIFEAQHEANECIPWHVLETT